MNVVIVLLTFKIFTREQENGQEKLWGTFKKCAMNLPKKCIIKLEITFASFEFMSALPFVVKDVCFSMDHVCLSWLSFHLPFRLVCWRSFVCFFCLLLFVSSYMCMLILYISTCTFKGTVLPDYTGLLMGIKPWIRNRILKLASIY